MIKATSQNPQLEMADRLSKESIISWLEVTGIKTPKLQEIEFRDHSFILQFLKDWSPELVAEKAGQVGITLAVLLKILYAGSQKNISVIYTLPTTSDARKLVTARLDPVLENCPYFQAKLKPFGTTLADSTELKRLGNSYLYFRGSWTEQQSLSIDADILAFDELDYSKPDIRELYRERLEGSESLHWEYSFSVPSRPGFGISKLFDKTNQYYWFIKCSSCNKFQTLEFETNIDKKKKIYICKFCRHELSDDDRRKGTWVPKYRTREIHGYHFSRLMCPWISAKRILLLEEKAPSLKHFKNYSLGEPYSEESKLISDQEIWGLVGNYDEVSSAKGTCVGIDQGDVFHLVIGRLEKIEDTNLYRKKIIAFKTAKDPQEVEDILNRYDMRMGIIDALPNKHTAKELVSKFKGRLFLSYYSTGISSKERYDLVNWTPNESRVEIQRTESIDNLFDSMYKAQFVFPRFSDNMKVVVRHFKNLTADYQTRYGFTVKVWKATGADHFVHALNLLNIAFDRSPGYLTMKESLGTSVRYASTGFLNKEKEEPESLEEFQRRRRKGPIVVDVLENKNA